MPLGHCAHNNGSLVLVGPNEPSFWDHFRESKEYSDGRDNPLDRWSKRVLDKVAKDVDGAAFYPFGGPPFHPFFTWALETGRFWSSPIQFLVHETEGLFVSFRGAILLDQRIELSPPIASPCETCIERPCLTACPVGAFANGYDVASCKGFLNSRKGIDCMSNGCAARRACPVGQGKRQPAQANFHMEAFK